MSPKRRERVVHRTPLLRSVRLHRALASLAATLTLLIPAHAEANGRYPSAQQLVVAPSDPARLWLRATYGFLTSGDAGKTWSWICESAIGYGPQEDPPLYVTQSGTALVATSLGLRMTTDNGCSWRLHPDVGALFTLDLTGSPSGTHVLALTTFVEPTTGEYELVVWDSDDAGARFTRTGPAIATDLAGQTLDVAPSDPSRLYVTGLVVRTPLLPDGGIPPASNPEGVLLRSRDAGRTWERRNIPGTSNSDWPLIAAVHPTNADELFVRVRGRPRARDERIESWLLYSADAGDTWTEVFRAEADMLGFALGPGGSPIYLGLGDSYDLSLQRMVDPAVLGVYRADAPRGPFTRRSQGQVGGLMQATAGIYVLGSSLAEGSEVGLSNDQGSGVAPVFVLGPALQGPPTCGFGTAETHRCAEEWPTACIALYACGKPDAGTPPNGRTDAGQKSRSPAKHSGGCGCRTSGHPAHGSRTLPFTFALVLGALRRRRVRERPQSCT